MTNNRNYNQTSAFHLIIFGTYVQNKLNQINNASSKQLYSISSKIKSDKIITVGNFNA
jgi:hypothetical protein